MHTLILVLDIWQKRGDVGSTIMKILSFRAEVLHMHLLLVFLFLFLTCPLQERTQTQVLSQSSNLLSVIAAMCFLLL